MTRLHYLIPGLAAILAVQVSSAQTKFPERAGEWEVTTTAPGSQVPPTTMLYCLNDEMWQKALTQVPSCSVQQLEVKSKGVNYNLDCAGKSFQMKGKVEMTFDGPEHMTAKGLFDMTMNGKTTSSTSLVAYHWKGATCSPNDVNLKLRSQ
jgi:hypothetical protein